MWPAAWMWSTPNWTIARKRVCAPRRILRSKRILITCGFCVIFFVLVPCVIYYLCYIPYLSPTGPVTLKRVIDAQIGMLNYHSTPGLGMDHPFQSPLVAVAVYPQAHVVRAGQL